MDMVNKNLSRVSIFIIVPCLLLLGGCQLINKGTQIKPDRPKTNPCIVLALPNSGPYSTIASKIKRGAAIAAEGLKKAGQTIRVPNIDTQNANWLMELEKLPEECAVVGGPLQENNYIQARKSGIFQKKVFFAFVPNLQGDDEGKQAWRFFPSPEDQAEALIRFVTNNLNIRSFGALYPDDTYGRRMTEIFEKALSKQHLSLNAVSYNPQAPATWSASAEKLIRPITAEDGKTPIPQTTFEALFLPDSWKNMPGLTNSLAYNGEDRLVLMGPMLWEQAVLNKKIPNSSKFALAVFPGAWSMNALPEPLKNANPDFWVALGYDFINFAANMGIDYFHGNEEVNKKAQSSASIIRALAPLTWNKDGKAAQNMYLFQVGPSGAMPASADRILQSRTAISEKAALRMQGTYEEPVQEQEILPPPKPENITPVQKPVPMQPGSPALSPVPVPSYKLRLPTQR